MKFLYEYRTRENELKEGAIDAPNREAAFAALKAQGIRPARLYDAPGLLNKLLGKGKRWTAIAVLSVVCAVLSFAIFVPRSSLPEDSALRALHSALFPALRTQHSALSTQFLELERQAREILPTATNDFGKAREQLRRLFLDRLDGFADNPQEQDAVRTLYGEIAIRLDLMESSARRGKTASQKK